jgi:N-acetylglutamate synthase/N-acetylornithine aminotransferase
VSVTFPRGFGAGAVTAGFKASGLPDLGVPVGERGTGAPLDPATTHVVGRGAGRSRVLGCDLSFDYVRINGQYTT